MKPGIKTNPDKSKPPVAGTSSETDVIRPDSIATEAESITRSGNTTRALFRTSEFIRKSVFPQARENTDCKEARPCWLEIQLAGKLPFTRRPCSGRTRKPERVCRISGHRERRRRARRHQKLRVIEHIERLGTKLQVERLLGVEVDILHQRQVRLVPTRKSCE